MKKKIGFFVGILISLFSFGQDVSAIIKEADRLENIPNEMAAYAKFSEALKINPTNLYALSECSVLCSRIGKRQGSTEARDNYYKAAQTYASTALKLNPNYSDANCAMAIALGRISLTKGGKQKINAAKEIKKYVDIALKYNAENYKAWHVLGRWHYELSNLNIVEKSAVKLLYGGLPASSLQQGIQAFEKAQSLTKGFVLNYFELAKAYHRNSENAKAIAALKTLLTFPNQTEDDAGIKIEAKQFLKNWE
jgi:tetratricopeptide (TPR) repeat protein